MKGKYGYKVCYQQQGKRKKKLYLVTNTYSSAQWSVRWYDNCHIIFNHVNFEKGYCAIYVEGIVANVEVINHSNVTADVYCIATNASGSKAESDENGVKINVQNSVLTSTTGTGIMLNIAGIVNVDNSTVEGDLQAVFMRAGTGIFTDSIFHLLIEDASLTDYFNNRTWGSGDTANVAVLTLGNKSPTAAYQRPVNVSLTRCYLTAEISDYPMIYVWSNNTEGNGVTLTYDTDTGFDGNIILGGTPVAALGEDDYGLFNLTVNGKTYAGETGPITIDPNAPQE